MPNVLINDTRTGYGVGTTQFVSDATALAWEASRWAVFVDKVAPDPLTAQEVQSSPSDGLTAAQVAGLQGLVSGAGVVANLTPGTTSAGAANYAALDAAFASGASTVSVYAPGVYWIQGQVMPGSNQTLYIAPGVTLKRQWKGTNESGAFLRNRNQPASNADTTTGNVGIKVTGGGTLDCNGYDATKVTTDSHYQDGMQWISVVGLIIDNIKIVNPVKTHGRLAKCSAFYIKDLAVDFDSVGGLSDGVNGKDALFIAGNCHYGRVRGVTGRNNDDGVTLNPCDVPTWSMPFAVGHISNMLIEDVYVDTMAYTPGGSTVALYTECWLDENSGLGAGTVDPFLGNKPAITALSQSAGLVTATTDIAHQLNIGSKIQISGANPAGYNTSNYTDGNGWAIVYDVPSPTTFQYFCNNGTGTYVSGAVLLQSWDMQSIHYRNIRGKANCKILSFRNKGGCASDVWYEDVRNVIANGSTNPQISHSHGNIFNLKVQDVKATGDQLCPLYDQINGAYLSGVAKFTSGLAPSELKQYSTSGQCYIQISLGADHVVIEGHYFRQAYISGETTRSPILFGAGVRMATIRDCRYYGSRNNQGRLFRAQGGDSTDQIINVESCWLGGDSAGNDGVQLGIQPSTTGSGRLYVNVRNTQFANTYASPISLSGKNVTINLDQVTLSNLTSGLIYFTDVNQNVEVNVGAINYNGQSLFNSSQAALTGGGLTVRGMNARMNVAVASRIDGACLYNTNAAANNGTDGAVPVGLYFCTGTASGSWKLAGTTGGANKQY